MKASPSQSPKPLFPILLFLACYGSVFGQIPSIQWQNAIGGTIGEDLQAIQQTADGGYILGGSSYSNATGHKTENCLGDWDYWVVKLDAPGNIVWQNTIGGGGMDKLQSIQQTSDGGYILGGYSWSGISGDKSEANLGGLDYWVVKLDVSGNIVWENTIGGNHHDELYSVRQTQDGGYILGGSSGSGISGDKTEINIGVYDYWVVKLDASGNIAWQNTIGGEAFDELWAVVPTADGGYFLAGSSGSGITGDKTEGQLGWDYWLVKLDSNGLVAGQNTIAGDGTDFIRTAVQTSDGGYLVGGYSNSNAGWDKTENGLGARDIWVLKLNPSLAIEWQNTLGGSNDDEIYTLAQTADGGYFLGGTSFSNISGDKTENSRGGYDYWILKLSTAGSLLWQKTIGGNTEDNLYSCRQTADGGYFLGGTSASGLSGEKTQYNQGDYDYWFLKLSPECPPISMTFTHTKPSCPGSANGKVRVNPPAPVTAYTYLWGTGATTREIANVPAGTYTVTLTRTATGCTASGTAVLTAPLPVAVGLALANITCFGQANGSVKSTATGGTGTKTHLWGSGATTATISGLFAGTYSVTATDTKGCTGTNSGTITEPTEVVLSHTVELLATGKYKTTLSAGGGTAYTTGLPHRYCKLSATGACSFNSTLVYSNLLPGSTHTFRARDAKNCQDEITVTLPNARPGGVPDSSTPSAPDFVVQPNPFDNQLIVAVSDLWETSKPRGSFQFQVFDAAGRRVLEKTIASGPGAADWGNTEAWPPGVYFIKVFDENRRLAGAFRAVKAR